MAKLTAAARKAMPASTFAGPGRSFPLNDANHDRAALSDVPKALHAGSITPSIAAVIRRRAKAALGKK